MTAGSTNAYTTILDLPVATTVSGSEEFWIVQGGTDRRTTLSAAVAGVTGSNPWVAYVGDYGTDGAALVQAIQTGKIVVVPNTYTDFTITNAADVFTVMQALYRINADAITTIHLPAGVFEISTGNLGEVGLVSANLSILGADPIVTSLTGIAAVSGSAGNWTVQLQVSDTTGMEAGQVLKLWNIGPLPILEGDNSVILLRDRPLPNELASPLVVLGPADFTAGSASVHFDSFAGAGNISNYIAVNDLLTVKGQTRSVTIVDDGTRTVTVDSVYLSGVLNTSAYWLSRPHAGTVGTGGIASTTVNGVGATAFISTANIGDLLLVNGEVRKITGIPLNSSLIVNANITITDGTAFSILSTGVLHEGAHVIQTVDSSTLVTVTNKSRAANLPINLITTGEVKAIKTVLKNNGSGEGLNFGENASLHFMNNIALQGHGIQSGLALNGEYPEGRTRIGSFAEFIGGDGFALVNWLYGAFVGPGCKLQLRKAAISGCSAFGVWGLEQSLLALRSTVISGCVGHGIQANSGSTTVFTEGRVIGNAASGGKWESGSVLYAEQPFSWGNTVYGFICAGASFNVTSCACSLNGSAGFRFEQQGSGSVARACILANGVSGIDAEDRSKFSANEIWSSGHAASSGYGVFLTEGVYVQAEDAGLTGNKFGFYLLNENTLSAPNVFIKGNSTGAIYALNVSTFRISGGYASGNIYTDNGVTGWIDGVGGSPTLINSVTSPNMLSLDGCIVYDGTATVLDLPPTSVDSLTVTNGPITLSGGIQTASISADTDNLILTSTTSVLKINPSAATWNITGITGGVEGRLLILDNIGNFSITLKNNTTSSNENRFLIGGDTIFHSGEMFLFRWDSTAQRWKFTSQLPSFSEITSKPTTLAGYGITDADVTVDAQIFSTPGTATWTKPAVGARWIFVQVISGGGAGGSGSTGADGAIRGGGAGGGGGGVASFWFNAIEVTSPQTVTVGAATATTAAGAGGTADGVAGSVGNGSSFGTLLAPRAGAGGAKGSSTAGATAGGNPGMGMTMTMGVSGGVAPGVGGAGGIVTTGNNGIRGSAPWVGGGPAGGAGGAAKTAAPASAAGGTGGGAHGSGALGLWQQISLTNGGSLSGTAGGAGSGSGGGAGGSATDASSPWFGDGGGGGGSETVTNQNGGAGGDGAAPGGGGGGGGGALGTGTSLGGTGGKGARGEVRVWTICQS